MRLLLVSTVCALILAGCDGVTKLHTPTRAPSIVSDPNSGQTIAVPAERSEPMHIALFFDGTGNNLNSTTNVGRLHQIVINQDRTDISAFYTSGVGADRTGPVGLGLGLGFRRDVESAYGFLSDHFKHSGDVVHLYGYSRGAFAARALAGLVHTAGLVDLSVFEEHADREKFLNDLFTAYKFPKPKAKFMNCNAQAGSRLEMIELRRCATEAVLKENGVKPLRNGHYSKVMFDIVGLWDTVETLGWPDGVQDPYETNGRYSDQICNMERVFHAVSLHDNRATVYTPILMTLQRLVRDCSETDISKLLEHFERVEEVWFNGDHGQTGGSETTGYLSGVSLNWMLRKISELNMDSRSIVPDGARVFEQPHDFINDAQRQNLLFRLLFKRRSRDISLYVQSVSYSNDVVNQEDALKEGSATPCEIKLHSSVKERGEAFRVISSREYALLDEGPVPELSANEIAQVLNAASKPSQRKCSVIEFKYVD